MISIPRIRPALLLIVVLSFHGIAHAQERKPDDLAEFYTYGDNYFLETATLPGLNSTKGRALVTFRISFDLLTFRRTQQAYQKSALYVATPRLFIEAVGSDGVIADRGSWADTARVQDYARTNSKADFLCGSIELHLRPGIYTLKYSIDDGTPGSGFTQNSAPLTMDDFSSPSPAIGTPIFVRSVVADTMVLTSIDGAAMFGRRLRAYIPIGGPLPPREIRYELATAPKKGEASRTLRSGSGVVLGSSAIDQVLVGDDIRVTLNRRLPDSVRSYGALIDCAADDLNVGDYILTLTASSGHNSVTDSARFKIRWVDMPFSLSKPEYAIRALYPIATDETIDELLSGGREQQRLAIAQFWEKRDPTPGSRFNEAMNEYYRRVDYSFFNFKSIGQNDGTFTDRGKVYILYGPPADIAREMQPNAAPREVWLYRNQVRKRFVFVDESRAGEYRLVEYNDL